MTPLGFWIMAALIAVNILSTIVESRKSGKPITDNYPSAPYYIASLLMCMIMLAALLEVF
jgi:hypothetical protein